MRRSPLQRRETPKTQGPPRHAGRIPGRVCSDRSACNGWRRSRPMPAANAPWRAPPVRLRNRQPCLSSGTPRGRCASHNKRRRNSPNVTGSHSRPRPIHYCFLTPRRLEAYLRFMSAVMAACVAGWTALGRLGLLVLSTAACVDPEWTAKLTLELSDQSQIPTSLYYGMRVAQISFLRLSAPVHRPYGTPCVGSK